LEGGGKRSTRATTILYRPRPHGTRPERRYVAISTTFGLAQLARFSVLTEEVREGETASALVPLQSPRQAGRYNRPERRRFI
jgi:hypothetical protein